MGELISSRLHPSFERWRTHGRCVILLLPPKQFGQSQYGLEMERRMPGQNAHKDRADRQDAEHSQGFKGKLVMERSHCVMAKSPVENPPGSNHSNKDRYQTPDTGAHDDLEIIAVHGRGLGGSEFRQ